MEPFKIHILGCGSALPTLRHNASSQIVEIRGKMFMVDCAEGTQMQLRRSKINFQRIQAVFISHMHGDHCFGLIGMISTFGLMGRTAPLDVYATKELGPVLDMLMKSFCNDYSFEVRFHAIDTKQNAVIYDDRSLTVETIPLQHRVPCCGFLFREKPTLPHIRRDMIDYLEIPFSQINNIKAGADWVTPDGKVIPNSRLVTPSDNTRSYAYCSDTRYIPDLWKLVNGATVLYHESTYASDCEDRARTYWHSTARQAAMVARDANVGKLLLGHYSARYNDESKILDEAKAVFPKSFLTNEGMTVFV
ncbi:ribonuclease Z [Prevotella lacticifex]|uniref:Ribonuclease Z n=1 Tax=Prevotella lacticifex TaxID=2854755 RepID=A0A9R1CWP7_9BACT|nr:ribonuclease Z [Prevotella lacticifex]MDY6266195.1 ribonuclease Z [Prevotella sp.]GJG35535.1 ribonuclease Z [Prevotella lacticifex]GJG39417.1 ribonuclease Z [Prevotella lacticifex]GJG41903.1 ribonuclease Z [Prevotella lacticifex]GJG45771.1 ribonuclease Z [Prevotella lacticifex]